MRRLTATLCVAAAALGFGGCGQPACSVSGAVAYQSEPVADGWITFTPADGKGQPVGGKIVAGRFAVSSLPPGRMNVLVAASLNQTFVRNTADLAEQAAKDRAAGKPARPATNDSIPADAVGNNQTIVLSPGPQVLDFELAAPRKNK